ncbi:MAG TPA: phasin family protein [Beijerinckiaceae bacterium]|jgi:hypothetical protein|nr:phasin family protein [Beijerinckiaceae bacterium]
MALDPRITDKTHDNVNAAFGGVVVASQNMQAIVSEWAQMSLESVDRAADAVDRFSKARSLDQIIEIQNNYLKSSIDSFARHGGKVAELVTAWPNKMGETFRRVSQNIVDASQATAKAAADRGGAMMESAISTAEQTADALHQQTH